MDSTRSKGPVTSEVVPDTVTSGETAEDAVFDRLSKTAREAPAVAQNLHQPEGKLAGCFGYAPHSLYKD